MVNRGLFWRELSDGSESMRVSDFNFSSQSLLPSLCLIRLASLLIFMPITSMNISLALVGLARCSGVWCSVPVYDPSISIAQLITAYSDRRNH